MSDAAIRSAERKAALGPLDALDKARIEREAERLKLIQEEQRQADFDTYYATPGSHVASRTVEEILDEVNGSATARTVSFDEVRGALVEALVDGTAQRHGGTVSKRYLTLNGASTTLVLVKRERNLFRVMVSRERISRYDPDKTYGVERKNTALVPLWSVEQLAARGGS